MNIAMNGYLNVLPPRTFLLRRVLVICGLLPFAFGCSDRQPFDTHFINAGQYRNAGQIGNAIQEYRIASKIADREGPEQSEIDHNSIGCQFVSLGMFRDALMEYQKLQKPIQIFGCHIGMKPKRLNGLVSTAMRFPNIEIVFKQRLSPLEDNPSRLEFIIASE